MASAITIDQCIEFLATYGASKNSVARVLDIPMETFLDICKAMPDVKWRPKGQTIGDIRALKKRKRNAEKRLETLSAPADLDLNQRVTMFGHTGTLREIIDRFASVHRRSVIHRIKLGESIQEAILRPTNRGPVRHECAKP